MDPVQHYRDRLSVFESESVPPGGLVFVGSSHVEWFDAGRLLPGCAVVNRGIASDRLDVDGRGVYRRLDVSVFDLRPAYVMLESGTNDLGELWRNGRPALADVAATYERTVAAIRTRLPDVPMDLVSVFPTRGEYGGMTGLAGAFNPHVRRVAGQYGCGYIDLYTDLVADDGMLRGALTDDGLHLNDAGYGLWAEALRPRLAAVLQPASNSFRKGPRGERGDGHD